MPQHICAKRANGKWSNSPSKPGRYNTRAECQAASRGSMATSKPRKSLYGLKNEIKKKVFSN